ncbi:hypothetical protein [Mimivirus argentum]|uniref:Uncharacterized protein n=1 Tax=Mimivirus sp. 'lentille' TaxID=1128146 RepID=H6WBD5_9VIRU|nr:hypothetical protein tv_L3 [Mimivirus lentille]AEY99255.1 hypothetical protein tv_L3 [Acanthamoeba castellanii mamavirus]UMZ08535.1 hypothetical protein [Mimivirus argentum]
MNSETYNTYSEYSDEDEDIDTESLENYISKAIDIINKQDDKLYEANLRAETEKKLKDECYKIMDNMDNKIKTQENELILLRKDISNSKQKNKTVSKLFKTIGRKTNDITRKNYNDSYDKYFNAELNNITKRYNNYL